MKEVENKVNPSCCKCNKPYPNEKEYENWVWVRINNGWGFKVRNYFLCDECKEIL